MRPTFPGAPVVAETRTLPSDVLGNRRSLKAVEAGGRIGAWGVAPCECIPRQQHDARAVRFAGTSFARRVRRSGPVCQRPMPALTRSRREVDSKGQSHKDAEAGDGESHRDEL